METKGVKRWVVVSTALIIVGNFLIVLLPFFPTLGQNSMVVKIASIGIVLVGVMLNLQHYHPRGAAKKKRWLMIGLVLVAVLAYACISYAVAKPE